MPEIAVLLSFRCAAAGAVHPTNTIAPHCRRSAGQASALGFSSAPRSGIASVHGVVAHFLFTPTPTLTGSGCLVSLRIGIGASELAASRAGDATLRAPPVVTLSAMI